MNITQAKDGDALVVSLDGRFDSVSAPEVEKIILADCGRNFGMHCQQ